MIKTESATILTELHYSDPESALNWLSKVFDFKKRMIVRDQFGKIVFSELELDEAIVAVVPEQPGGMRSPKAANGISTQTTMIRFNRNIDEHFRNALEHGATILSNPETHFFGDRAYIVSDIEGHTWSFAQRLPDAGGPPPDGWGIEFPSED